MKRSTVLVTLVIILAVITSACGQGASPTAPPPSAAPVTHTVAAPTQPAETPTLPPTDIPSPTPTPLPIVVSSAEDSGPSSLRQALSEAQPGDTITFDPAVFPPETPTTIRLTSGLPELGQGNLTMDASNAGVILDGSQITTPEFQHGLAITSDHNTIRGLQIVGFTDAGIALHSGAQYNLIGGDRGNGTGPLGEGNLISGNANFGIGLWGEGTSFNTIQGNIIGVNPEATAAWGQARDGIHSNGANDNLITANLIGGNENGVYLCCVADGKNKVTNNIIGTDPSGKILLGNRQAGVLIDRTHSNVIGPGNIIAHNDGQGVLFWEDTPGNTVTQNSIHDNGGQGINPGSNRLERPPAPLIFDFNLEAGSLAGLACANCTVEIFSDSSDEGSIYEGQAVSDSGGAFTLSKGTAFAGPHLTTTARDTDGNTSEFSAPTSGASSSSTLQVMTLQDGNNLPKTGIVLRRFRELADNRIGDLFPLDRYPSPCPPAKYDWSFTHVGYLSLKWARLSLDRLELEQARSLGDYSQFEINACQDEMVTLFTENDITILYTIVYWDEKLHADRYPDYRNEEEVQRYLDYTRLIVRHFKGRIQYYEILNEALVYVKVADYINLVRRVIPIIREEDPQAKIVVGGSSNLLYSDCTSYLFSVLKSDVMPLVDGVALHPMYGASPQYDDVREYYYNYPSLIGEIKSVAAEHGFTGEFIAEEMSWRTSLNPNPYESWEYTPITAAKYYARGILMNLGMDLRTGIAGENYDQIPAIVRVVQNLSASMGGAKTESLAVKIQSQATNITSYTFSLPDGDMLLAIWTDGTAVDEDPGVLASLTFPGLSAQRVTGIDVLNSFEQVLASESENGNLVVPDLLVKDYPILLRLRAVAR